MTLVEFKNLIELMNNYYPQNEKYLDNKKMNAWYMALADIDYKAARENLISYSKSNKYPPNGCGDYK